MKIISHRGNINGIKIGLENRPSYIDSAIQLGLEVEVDVRYINNKIYLGHDFPEYIIENKWIEKRIRHLWFHCKNLEAAQYLNKNFQDIMFFCHSQDPFVCTSIGYFWVHDLSFELKEDCIIPLLNKEDIIKFNNKNVYGICTDHVTFCKDNLISKGLYYE